MYGISASPEWHASGVDFCPMPTLRTLAAPLRHEIPKIKGSRFIASARPVASAAAAMAFVEGLRQEHRTATHNCFAWRLAPGEDLFRYSDDGEPNSTAGRPILQEIDGRGLHNVVLVVTRYYGGTNLGMGGLLRAYGGAAAAALEAAEILETAIVRPLSLVFSYDLSGAVEGVLAAHGLHAMRSEYGAEVSLVVEPPIEDAETVQDDLREATAGRIRLAEAD